MSAGAAAGSPPARTSPPSTGASLRPRVRRARPPTRPRARRADALVPSRRHPARPPEATEGRARRDRPLDRRWVLLLRVRHRGLRPDLVCHRVAGRAETRGAPRPGRVLAPRRAQVPTLPPAEGRRRMAVPRLGALPADEGRDRPRPGAEPGAAEAVPGEAPGGEG